METARLWAVETTAVSGPQRAARSPVRPGELEIGGEQFRKSVRQDKDDRGGRDDRLISKDAKELKRLRKENSELRRTQPHLARDIRAVVVDAKWGRCINLRHRTLLQRVDNVSLEVAADVNGAQFGTRKGADRSRASTYVADLGWRDVARREHLRVPAKVAGRV